MTDFNTSFPIAGDIKNKKVTAVADTYYLGMPLKYEVTPTGSKTAGAGDGTITALSAGKNVKAGSYVLTFTGATAFDLTNADGSYVNSFAFSGATTFELMGITFTITPGSTPFDATTVITIVVGTAGTYKYTATEPEVICWEEETTLSTPDYLLVAVAGSEINESGIVDDSGTTLTVTEAMKAKLLSEGIIIKS